MLAVAHPLLLGIALVVLGVLCIEGARAVRDSRRTWSIEFLRHGSREDAPEVGPTDLRRQEGRAQLQTRSDASTGGGARSPHDGEGVHVAGLPKPALRRRRATLKYAAAFAALSLVPSMGMLYWSGHHWLAATIGAAGWIVLAVLLFAMDDAERWTNGDRR